MVNFSVRSEQLDAKLKEVLRITGDLRPLWIQIAREFYKGNKAIFALKSAGKYVDFKGPKIANTWKNPGYPERRTRDGNLTARQWVKQKKYGLEKGYPLLKATGKLEASITKAGSDDNIQIITKESLVIGTSVPYAAYHQYGTKNIPMRKFLFIDPTTVGVEGSRRDVAWAKAAQRYLDKVLTIQTGGV